MNLATLLSGRPQILRQAHLANLALAYETLATIAERISRARLRGRVLLQPPAPETERFCPTLLAVEGSQSVLEEHFTDQDLMDLADVLQFVLSQDGPEAPDEIEFSLESFATRFVDPVRAQLRRAGVEL